MKQWHAGVLLVAVSYAAVMAVPPLRSALWVQFGGSDKFPNLLLPALWGRGGYAPWRPETTIAQQFRSDPQVQEQAAEKLPSYRPGFTCNQTLGGCDEVIRQFPGESWLIANRLRRTIRLLHDNRLAGELENPKRGGPVPPRQPGIPSPNAADVRKAIAVARAGIGLEPQNCYYDLMLAYHLFAAGRDAQALQAIDTGSRKTLYNDHVKDDVQAELHVRHLAYGRPAITEECLAIIEGHTLPDWTAFRHTARMAVWHGVQEESRARHEQALHIYAAVARLGGLIRRDGWVVNDSWMGDGLEATAWQALIRRPTSSENKYVQQHWGNANWRTPTEIEWRLALRVKKFADYASAHGRSDLAAEARREGRASARWYRQVHEAWDHEEVDGVPKRTFILASWTTWTGAGLLCQVLLCLAGWLLVSGLLWLRSAPGEAVQPRDLLTSILCCMGLTATIDIFGIWSGASWYMWFPHGTNESYLDFSCFTAPVPVVLGFLICGILSVTRHQTATPVPAPPAPEYDGLSALEIPPDRMPLFRRLFSFGLIIIVVGSWFVVEDSYPWLPPLLTGGYICAQVVVWYLFAPAHRMPERLYTMRWYQQTLATWIVVASVAYALVSFAGLPARRSADARLTRFVQHGELAAMLPIE